MDKEIPLTTHLHLSRSLLSFHWGTKKVKSRAVDFFRLGPLAQNNRYRASGATGIRSGSTRVANWNWLQHSITSIWISGQKDREAHL